MANRITGPTGWFAQDQRDPGSMHQPAFKRARDIGFPAALAMGRPKCNAAVTYSFVECVSPSGEQECDAQCCQ
jgi:hypothetical protein